LSKCEFWIDEVLFLGHIINKEGLAVDPKKVVDILNWKAPIDARGIKSFIGMAGYYRGFIEGFSKIAKLKGKCAPGPFLSILVIKCPTQMV
jgi:hypothetical protein